MQDQRLAVHRTIVVVDVEGFGNQRRTNRDQVAIRDGLYRAMREASAAQVLRGMTAVTRIAATEYSSWFLPRCPRACWRNRCRPRW
jgi:hypothetical protein